MLNASLSRALSSPVRLTIAAVLLLAGAAVFTPAALVAQTAAASFNGGTGANDFVYHVAEQTDGRILIGGRFTVYDGVPRSGVARLNSDGSLDLSFNPGSGTVGSVYYVAEQPDGRIYLAGDFTVYDGVPCAGVIRLNADGTVDFTFNPGNGADGGVVFSLAVQVDGKVVVGGRFATFNGAARTGVARLNTDGTLDPTFDSGTGITGNSGNGTNGVYDVVLQPDGRVLLGGYFNQYDGTFQPGVVRVNTDGSRDASFITGNGVGRGNTAQTVALQSDGKVIVGGNFIRFDNAPAAGIVRLNPDGSIDPTFNAGTGASGRSDVVYTAALQADGKIIVGGDFAEFNGIGTDGIVRLNADGSVDGTFNTNGGVGSSYVYDAALQADGEVLISGNFSTVGGASSPGVARLDANGGNESVDVVTISADTRRIGEGEPTYVATVTLTRTGNTGAPLEVFYTTGGAAVSGVDYQPLSGKRTIKAGNVSVSFSVIAKVLYGATDTVPVKIVLAAGAGYTVGSVPPFVKIKIVH